MTRTPATASGDDLPTLLQLTVAESYRQITRGSTGGSLLEEDGLLLYAGAHPSPVIVNGALRLRAGLPAGEILRRADDFFHSRSHAYGITTRTTGDEDLEHTLATAGFTVAVELPALALRHTIPESPGVALQPVRDDRGAEDYATVIGDAFAEQEQDARALAATVFPDRRSLSGPHLAAFVAYVHDEPVAAAMMILAYRVAFLEWVGTRRAFRRRGLGRAVTAAAANAGFACGAELSALLTSPAGDALYRMLGYRPVGSYRRWVPPQDDNKKALAIAVPFLTEC